ncbi:DUF4349 domain-containing protein [Sediminispirochaeta smaragdinae]|uniref:DUF4349 domain-containing protein n=1 Tax=Sediminispirochaeta smaragdinae (strain DSM 11293 / JCM 15392 / SEBR 4228) TaxID=573413 RepID=E1R985_SEDSS|nr:DUF4349 domain-containing protein [Sediminispirochaeta smaragdinae]ADK83054.1 hypothetical protein Spirs_3969 [Sediminispirochaeta smaragdinae DSM 11293]
MKRSIFYVTACFLVPLSFFMAGCGSKTAETAAFAPMAEKRVGSADLRRSVESFASFDTGGGALAQAAQEAPDTSDRKLVSTGSMELEVNDLDIAESAVRKATDSAGGYVQSSSRYEDTLSMELKIPAEAFSAFLDAAEGFGRLESRSINVEDVSDRYYDLEHRIKNKEILVERYQKYLQEAKSVEDLLTVERELNDATTELEQLKGSFQNLDHRVSFSTLHMVAHLPSWEQQEDPLPSIRAGLKRFGRMIVQVLYVILFLLLGLVVFGIPGVLVVGALYWLAFGKVGLVRRFWHRLRPSRRTKNTTEKEEE